MSIKPRHMRVLKMSDLEKIELTIEQAKEAIADVEAMERLKKNRDFKRIFEKGFFDAYAVNLVYLKADPNMRTPEDQEDIIKDIDSIGRLRMYLSAIYQKGHVARKDLADAEGERAEILAEEV